MNPLTFIIVIFLIVVLLLLLPVLSGVGSFKVQTSTKNSYKNDPQEVLEEDEYQGYIPPDELRRRKEAQKSKPSTINRLKENLNVTKEDFPLKFSTGLNSKDQQQQKLRRRGNQVNNINEYNDPSAFDFDLDELIEQEQREDEEDLKREFEQRVAKSKEELEELV